MSLPLDEAYRQQLVHWRSALHSGAERIGWKVGFNAPALQQRLGLSEPVIGHLTSGTLVGAAGSHSLAGAVNPVVEPELAVEIGPDASVAGLAPALEIVDLSEAPTAETAGEIVAANVFHRAVVIRPSDDRVTADGVVAAVTGGAEPRDPVDAGGVDVPGTVTLVQRVLQSFGESLQTGDRVIAGSLVAPIPVRPGDTVALDLGGLGRAEVSFTP